MGVGVDPSLGQLRLSEEIALSDAPAPSPRSGFGLVDARGAAAMLGVPASWVMAEARADRIPHVRLGRYVRFDPDELREWWRSRRRGPWRSRGAAATVARTGS